MPHRRAAVAASQHPDAGQALAEVVGDLTERQNLAPSLTVVAVCGRLTDRAETLGAGIHTLLQSDQTVVIALAGLVGGGRVLDPAGSLAVLSLIDIEVTVDRPDVDVAAPTHGPATVGAGGLRLRVPEPRDPDARILLGRPDGLESALWFTGDGRRRATVLQLTLHSVDPVLVSSSGAIPVGLPAPADSVSGTHLLRLDGAGARSMVMDRVELDDADAGGPAVDLPLMMVELIDDPTEDRFVPVIGSTPDDDGLILSRPIDAGSVIQIHRHDPEVAVADVVAHRRRQSRPEPSATLLSSTLPPGAADRLVASTAQVHDVDDLFGVVERPRRGPELHWPSASLLTLR
jgi:hypothetical protein